MRTPVLQIPTLGRVNPSTNGMLHGGVLDEVTFTTPILSSHVSMPPCSDGMDPASSLDLTLPPSFKMTLLRMKRMRPRRFRMMIPLRRLLQFLCLLILHKRAN